MPDFMGPRFEDPHCSNYSGKGFLRHVFSVRILPGHASLEAGVDSSAFWAEMSFTAVPKAIPKPHPAAGSIKP